MLYVTLYLMIGLVLFMIYKPKMENALENELSYLVNESVHTLLHKVFMWYAVGWPIFFPIDYFTIFRKK